MAQLNTTRYIDRDSGALFNPRVDGATIKVMVKSGQWREATTEEVAAHAAKVAAAQKDRAARRIARAAEAERVKQAAEAAARQELSDAAVDTGHPEPEVEAPTPEPKPDAPRPQAPPSAPAPERPNRGASLASWAAYADAHGIEYPDGAGRDEVRAAVEALDKE